MTIDEKCPECSGRGWRVGDCHPRETCGVCLGVGTTEVANMRAELRALRAVAEAAEHYRDMRWLDDATPMYAMNALEAKLKAWRGLR